ncbi:MAG: AAA family ATPase [Oscillospiraceae bacterium]|nr:AAA family ATPase [Oscillospiraceae bacterium]
MGMITMAASAKDGAGKSSLCVFLADALSAMGKRVLVIELDNGLRSLDIYAGVYGMTVYDIFDVLSGRCEPDRAIVKAPAPRKEIYVLSAPYNYESLKGDQFVKLCTALSESYDNILIDTACYNDTMVAAGTVAMNAILLATPDPVGVRDARIVADRLTELEVPKLRLALSRIVPSRIDAGVVPDLDYCIDNIGLQLIGAIPEDDDIALYAAMGHPLPGSSLAARVYANIAARLCGDDVPLAIR